MAREFLAAWRDRTVRCLLLEDLDEIARYNGAANGTAAEMRIFQSNLAVLPLAGAPMQWRLAEIDALRFDDAAYQIVAESGGERLVLGKLAKKTDEAWGTLSGALDVLHTEVAGALHDVFPFLEPEPLRRLQALMPEGRSAALPDLAAIDPRLPDALIARAVDAALRPYFDALRERAAAPSSPASNSSGRTAQKPAHPKPATTLRRNRPPHPAMRRRSSSGSSFPCRATWQHGKRPPAQAAPPTSSIPAATWHSPSAASPAASP